MNTIARPNRINIDLGLYKGPWIQYCTAHAVSPSAAFRQIVAKLVNTAGPPTADVERGACSAKVRRQITLTSEEDVFLAACAHAEGYAPSRWLIALIQARMGRVPQFGQHELQTLGQSNLALLALGRNLNQIARVLNTGGHPRTDSLAVIARLEEAIHTHTASVSAAISRNIERWDTK
jgi:hypothetical protein